jgi:hypothetical protein
MYSQYMYISKILINNIFLIFIFILAFHPHFVGILKVPHIGTQIQKKGMNRRSKFELHLDIDIVNILLTLGVYQPKVSDLLNVPTYLLAYLGYPPSYLDC